MSGGPERVEDALEREALEVSRVARRQLLDALVEERVGEASMEDVAPRNAV